MIGPHSSVNLEVQKEGITEEQPNTTCSLESNVTPSDAPDQGSLKEIQESDRIAIGMKCKRLEGAVTSSLRGRGTAPKKTSATNADYLFLFETVRIILALAAHMRWTVFQFDVKSAFLNGELKKEQFNMEGCNTEEIPMNVNEKLVIDDGTGMADARKFRSLVGRLIYLTHPRPDLAYAVGLVSKVYALSNDWAGAKDDMKSTSRNCFMFGSGVVTWALKKQAIVALSSTEAEYISAAAASKLCG
ncbi:retrovirus-related pol polyprotein from transposon TNT 1-94 [Tanacetum coccineum]